MKTFSSFIDIELALVINNTSLRPARTRLPYIVNTIATGALALCITRATAVIALTLNIAASPPDRLRHWLEEGNMACMASTWKAPVLEKLTWYGNASHLWGLLLTGVYMSLHNYLHKEVTQFSSQLLPRFDDNEIASSHGTALYLIPSNCEERGVRESTTSTQMNWVVWSHFPRTRTRTNLFHLKNMEQCNTTSFI